MRRGNLSAEKVEVARALIARGREAFARADYVAAAGLFEQAVAVSESQTARVTAYLELGKALDLLGKRRSAQACYRRIMALTDDWTCRDQARRLFRQPYRR